MRATRSCPYCAEEISAEAVRCRYCRSRLVAFKADHWYRGHPERRLGGVAIAIASAFSLPVGWVRIGFIGLSFLHLSGLVLYGVFWLVIPFALNQESLLEHGLGRAKDLAARLRGSGTDPCPPHDHGDRPEGDAVEGTLPLPGDARR